MLVRLRALLACSGTAGSAFALLALAITAGDASARQATDAGTRDADSAPADAGGSPACSFHASGAATSQGACSARIIYDVAADAAHDARGFEIAAASREIQSAKIWLRFLDGRPQSGVAQQGRFGAVPFVGKATIVGANGIEWFGNAGIQGTFRLTLTSARRFRTEAGTSLELHGTLELELPPANLMARHPSAPPHPPLIFRASF